MASTNPKTKYSAASNNTRHYIKLSVSKLTEKYNQGHNQSVIRNLLSQCEDLDAQLTAIHRSLGFFAKPEAYASAYQDVLEVSDHLGIIRMEIDLL